MSIEIEFHVFRDVQFQLVSLAACRRSQFAGLIKRNSQIRLFL